MEANLIVLTDNQLAIVKNCWARDLHTKEVISKLDINEDDYSEYYDLVDKEFEKLSKEFEQWCLMNKRLANCGS